jgi:DNA-binding HxlR family transcriptional regulator
MRRVRSYGQYCAVAKALDVVGDRWTLLIVRELLLRGACRYTDVREGLPGIATNLLADRLRELERAQLISRRQAPPPIAATLFELTERGRELEPVLHALGRWGVPYMAEGPHDADEFRSRWLSWPVETFLADNEPDAPPMLLAVEIGEEPMVIEVGAGEVRSRPGEAENPDATLGGSAQALLGLLSGRIDLEAASALGLRFSGSPRALARVQPSALASSV